MLLSSCAITGFVDSMDHNKHVKLVKKKTNKTVVKADKPTETIQKIQETEQLTIEKAIQIEKDALTFELEKTQLPVLVIENLIEEKQTPLVVSNSVELAIELSNITKMDVNKTHKLITKAEKKVNKIVSKTNPAFKQDLIESIKNTEIETASLTNDVAAEVVKAHKVGKASDLPDEDDKTLLYILAFVIPFVAVGLVTDWEIKDVLINLLLTALCGIPGIIHAFIKVKNYYESY